jgi:hypothetical protein
MTGAVEKAIELLDQTPGSFMPSQFENPANPASHEQTTALEILEQTDRKLSAFVTGVGTGGTASGVGRVLQAESLDRQARSAGRIMAWLGGLHLAIAAIVLIVAMAMTASPQGAHGAVSSSALLGMGVVIGIIAIIFLGLSFWARVTPLPAAITGLVIYSTLTVVDLLLAIDSSPEGFSARGLVVRFVVIGCLAKAVSAGIKHRALLREASAAA